MTELRFASQALTNWKASVLGLVVSSSQNLKSVKSKIREVKFNNQNYLLILQYAQIGAEKMNNLQIEINSASESANDLAKIGETNSIAAQ